VASESALVVLVPEAEFVVKPFRDMYDPSAAAGFPAHVTLLYPFKSPEKITEKDLDNLRRCIALFEGCQFSLEVTRRFSGVLYLVPQPDEFFRRLTVAIWDRYPKTPPYGGKYPEIVPHLTIANHRTDQELDRIAAEFERASWGKLPISAVASEVQLLDNRSGRWEVRATFNLRA
jgi:2'-5' RNA ligase